VLLTGIGNAATVSCSDANMVESIEWYMLAAPGSRINEFNRFNFDCGVYNNLTVINHVTDTKYWDGHKYTQPSSVPNMKYGHGTPAYSYTWLGYGQTSSLDYGQNGDYWRSVHITYDNNYWLWGTMTFVYSNDSLDKYTVSGAIVCLDWAKLYILNYDGNYSQVNYTEDVDPSYEFSVIDGCSYKLMFSDYHLYYFTVDGANANHDYDNCVRTEFWFKESCGNLNPDSEGYYCMDWTGGGGICREFYAPSGILSISNESIIRMKVYTNTFIGQSWWLADPIIDGERYNCFNEDLNWKLKVIVQNESNDELINDAIVKVDQTCYCTGAPCTIDPDTGICTCSGTSVRQKKTVNGIVDFAEMSLQDASLLVMKTGYKPLNENSTGYSAFLSGRANFSSKTWVVKLANSNSNNSSSFYEVPTSVGIYFKDVTGDITTKILDTDANVYMYYQNNNSNEEAMTMRFESSSTHSYFMPEQTWTIAHDTAGYKTIANSYFTPWDYSYRGVIYNSSIYGWNITIPLTVRNGTRETEQHYQNLTTNLWFMYASDGKVDYRDDMKVVIHGGSNNTTLLNIDVELWKDGAYIACKNLTATDFINADFPYYYIWNPVFDYVTGSNYSIRMYGFDRTLLETDYVQCVTDDTTRKNKLTIAVKDRAGNNLNNAYIYLEGWGSLPTGSIYYNAYEGIDNGAYRYKASKSGYTSDGWDTVNLTDEDKTVWYVLSGDYTNTSTVAQKFTDDDIKEFFFPMMFFLLICIVLGGLKYVAQ